MAELTLGVARNIAGALVTIGHPYHQAAIDATALDLMKWCKGAFVDGRPVSPERQAESLVAEARSTWDGWPEKGGTKALLELFRTMYPPNHSEVSAEWSPLTFEQTVAKGLILPPCPVCDDNLYLGESPNIVYCTACPAGRRNAKWEGEKGLDRLNRPPMPAHVRGFSAPALITPEQMARALEDETRRRTEQFRRVGVD